MVMMNLGCRMGPHHWCPTTTTIPTVGCAGHNLHSPSPRGVQLRPCVFSCESSRVQRSRFGPGFLLAPDGTALLRDIIQPRIPSIDSHAISSLLVSIRRSASQSDETWIFPHSPVNGNTLFIFTLFIYLVQKNKILL